MKRNGRAIIIPQLDNIHKKKRKENKKKRIQRWRNIHARRHGAAHAQDLGISPFHTNTEGEVRPQTHLAHMTHLCPHHNQTNLTIVKYKPYLLIHLPFIYTLQRQNLHSLSPVSVLPQFPFIVCAKEAWVIVLLRQLLACSCESGSFCFEDFERERVVFPRDMSCNGCRVLRKGCSESCILRPCLQWIDTAEAQGHATVFVAKFFGRAGLMSFISNVPENQRPGNFDYFP